MARPAAVILSHDSGSFRIKTASSLEPPLFEGATRFKAACTYKTKHESRVLDIFGINYLITYTCPTTVHRPPLTEGIWVQTAT